MGGTLFVSGGYVENCGSSESRQIMKYDEEEMEILEAYEAGKMKLLTPSLEEIEAIKSAAESTITPVDAARGTRLKSEWFPS